MCYVRSCILSLGVVGVTWLCFSINYEIQSDTNVEEWVPRSEFTSIYGVPEVILSKMLQNYFQYYCYLW